LMVVVDAILNGEPFDRGLKFLLFGGGTIAAAITVAIAEEIADLRRQTAKALEPTQPAKLVTDERAQRRHP